MVNPFSMVRVREDFCLDEDNKDHFSEVFRVNESDVKTLFKDMRDFFRGRAT